jgi:hypothetical protein
MSGQNVEVLVGHAQDISVKFHDSELINKEVFPMIELMSPKQKITRYNKGEQFQSGASERAPGTRIKTTQVERDTVDANTKQYAASDMITREDLRDAGIPNGQSPPIELATDSIEKNAKDLDLGREIRVAEAIFADTWSDGVAGGKDQAGSWLAPSTSTFLADFDVALSKLKREGVNPKSLRLMLDFGTMQAIKRIDDMREQLKYVGRDSLTADSLANILQIGSVVVGGAVMNTADAGSTDAYAGQYIWEKNDTKGSAFLYAFQGPGRKKLNAGVQTRSKLDNKQVRITESYWHNEKKGHVYDSMEETGTVVTANSAGYLWIDTILT